MAKRRAEPRKGETDRVRILVVEARFYEHISDELLAGATEVLQARGADVTRVTVPGALEIPAAIAIAVDAARRGRVAFDGVVALGCVIRGKTHHFDIVANESARALMDLAVRERLAIGNGILTVDTEAQARDRLGGDKGHKGVAAAQAALTMIALKHRLARC